MNNLALAGALATAPSSAFAELRERPRFWFPLLVLVASTVVIVYWYYSAVDIEWLKDAMFSNNPDVQKLPEADRAKAMAIVGRNTLLYGSVIAALFGVPIFFLLHALYFLLAGKVTKLPQSFKHWFSLVCWSSMALLLGTVVSVIMLSLSDTPQMSPSILQSLSLNELVLHIPIGSPGQALAESLTIPVLLSWALMIVGVHTWSQRSWVFSTTLVLLPIVVIYGCWGAFAFR